jgi:hypothetical protein
MQVAPGSPADQSGKRVAAVEFEQRRSSAHTGIGLLPGRPVVYGLDSRGRRLRG